MVDKKREDWGFLAIANQTEDIARQMKDMVSGRSNGEDINRFYAEQQKPKQELGDEVGQTQRPAKSINVNFVD